MTPEKAQTMSPSKKTDYDALEATTRIEDITNDEVNQDTLQSLKDDDGELCRLSLVSEDVVDEGDYHPKSSEELGWLGHFAKKSAHLDGLYVFGSTRKIFENCSEQSIDRFFEVLGSCNKIKRVKVIHTDLADIISKLGPSMNKNITRWDIDDCYLGAVEVNQLFTAFQGMKNLEGVDLNYIDDEDAIYRDVDDDIMARCIPLLAACTRMRELNIRGLGLHNNSCEAMSAIFPRMAALHELDLSGNSIDDDCVEVLVRGLAECKHLHSLTLSSNVIGDDGLEILIRGLPASVNTLDLGNNEIALARQLPLLRFRVLSLMCNALSHGGPGVIAASLANPKCRLEEIDLRDTNIGDEEAAILAPSLRNNQRLIAMHLDENINITKAGWDAFLPVLCDKTNINATHGSNHTLQCLELEPRDISRDVQMMLDRNLGLDRSRVAADKILQVHRHLDMKPLFDRQLDLLPYVIRWLYRFTEYHPDPELDPELSSIIDKYIARAPRADLKLSSIFEFVRAMPMEVVNGVAGRKKTKKRRRSSS